MRVFFLFLSQYPMPQLPRLFKYYVSDSIPGTGYPKLIDKSQDFYLYPEFQSNSPSFSTALFSIFILIIFRRDLIAIQGLNKKAIVTTMYMDCLTSDIKCWFWRLHICSSNAEN